MAFIPLGIRPREPHAQRCRSHLEIDPITAVSCRAKVAPLLRTSKLDRPHGSHLGADPCPKVDLVEAPGTAPGSVTPILRAVYRHSRSPDPSNIGGTRAGRNQGNRLRSTGAECPLEEIQPVLAPEGLAAIDVCRRPEHL